VVSPHAGDFVDERFLRVRIFEHVQHGKIGNNVARGERRKRQCDECELRERGRPRNAHQRHVIDPRADQRHDGLDQRQPERQHQRVMADLRDHLLVPVSSFQ
jgi:hypothetical protein